MALIKCYRSNLPTVVVAHGGPDYRTDWEFSPLSQLLSSRGYLVLELNYRYARKRGLWCGLLKFDGGIRPILGNDGSSLER